MNSIEVKPEDLLSAERQIPPNMPIVMLNLVTYRESVEYPGMQRCTGREAYLTRYAPAFNKAVAAAGVSGIEVVYLGTVAASIVPRQKCQWDEVVLVRYPSFSALRKVIESPLYKSDAEPLRKAALKDWQFIVTLPSTRTS
ncbi:MAG: hypothetical protein ACJ8R9_20240 [Steroidobacteraceae bacterium]